MKASDWEYNSFLDDGALYQQSSISANRSQVFTESLTLPAALASKFWKSRV